jgi:hypothetical protein
LLSLQKGGGVCAEFDSRIKGSVVTAKTVRLGALSSRMRRILKGSNFMVIFCLLFEKLKEQVPL